MDKEKFSSLHGRKLVLLPQRDNTVDIGLRSRDSRDDTWTLFATT